MRLVTYNILDGGEGRADPLGEVIEAQRPDVIALVEADVPAVVDRLARRMGMDYAVATGPGHAVALLSRWPIRQSIDHSAFRPGLTRSLLEATVLDPSGQAWPIGVLHLPAGATAADEQSRLQELAVILDVFEPHRAARRPHLLCGDFNSNSPNQKIDPDRCKSKTQSALAANGGDLPRQVVRTLLDAGYVDAYAARHDESAELVGSFTTQHPGQRVDYVFGHGLPHDHYLDAWVEQDVLAKYASYHFPVVVEIAGVG